MSTNISKQKRDDLILKIKCIHSYITSMPQDENTAALLTYLGELTKEVKSKKYGLVFEEHHEGIDEELAKNVPVLTEEKSLFINNGGQLHFLIEGDNLAALQLLLKTHRDQVDLIYIDPPYNTGSKDFIYDDDYIGKDDGYRHSKWMSFMEKRLSIARQLLSLEGCIFIQISDIELAQLKSLCDTIFGEENFLNIISVNMKNIAGASGGGEDKRFKKNCEYILIYAKNYLFLPIFNGAYKYTEISELIKQYKIDKTSWKYTSVLYSEGNKEYLTSTVDGDGNEIKVFSRRNAVIKSVAKVAKDEGITERDVYKKYAKRIFQTAMPQSSIRPRVMEAVKGLDVHAEIISIEYVPKTGRNKGKVYEQFYKGNNFRLFAWLQDVSEEIDGVLYKRDLQGTYWDYAAETKNLTKEGGVEFKNGKKPVSLMQRIISLYPLNDITVLDFFAGSGSTGHAVVMQNQEDKGLRHFILCTNNQNGICREKTYKRLKNIICGYTNERGKAFSANLSSLKYYRIDFVPISERIYYEYADELLLHVRELVELENGINFTGNAEIAIVLKDEELEAFISNVEEYTACKLLYRGYDTLLTAEQEAILQERDIVVNVIPDYYYRDLEVGK